MNLFQINNLIKQGGNKIILVENDEAELVVMSFAEYERLVASSSEKVTEGKAGVYISPASLMPMSPSVGTIKSVRPAITFEEMRDTAMRLEDVQLKDLPIEEAWG